MQSEIVQDKTILPLTSLIQNTCHSTNMVTGRVKHNISKNGKKEGCICLNTCMCMQKSCHNTQEHEKFTAIIQGQLFPTQTVASEL
jgi:hypothetical protein